MAVSQAAYAAEKAIGHQGDEVTAQDIANYSKPGHGDPSATMKALTWQGKNKVIMEDVPRPKIIEDNDVILRVTGSTVCGSDLHLLHGAVIEMAKGDILGHEFCGIVDEVGPAVQGIKKGGRYVASFQIACGDVSFRLYPCQPSSSRSRFMRRLRGMRPSYNTLVCVSEPLADPRT